MANELIERKALGIGAPQEAIEEAGSQLGRLSGARRAERRVVAHARTVFSTLDGSPHASSERMEGSRTTVRKWRHRAA